MDNNATLNTVIITASVTLITVLISSIVALIINIQSKKNEHKLSILKILLDAAYKEYEFRTKQEIAIALEKNEVPQIKSFTEYIIFYSEMSKIFSKEMISEEDIIITLRRNKKLIDAYYDNRNLHRPKNH